MQTPRTLAALAFGLTAFATAPAFAETQPDAKTVDITVDLNAPAEEIYDSIRSQAWDACKPELGGHYVAARVSARRTCQKAMIADVIEALETPELTRLAEDAKVCVNS